MLIIGYLDDPKTLKEGDRIYISELVSKLILDSYLFSINDVHNYRESYLPKGIWKVKSCSEFLENSLVEILNDNWGNGKEVVLLVFRNSNLVLKSISGIDIGISVNSISRVFNTFKEVQKENDKREYCILCNKKLNIISQNLRFCYNCENEYNE